MRDRVFRDPVHGLIEFKGGWRPLQGILETRAMQRLRRIHQVGFARLVYPGAEHSRFGHALGAYHVARRITSTLGVEARVARHVAVAALLHDVGHGPFSHAWEQALPGEDHERWGRRLVVEDDQLRGALEALDPQLPDTLVAFWDKTYRPTFARKLVSSQLDVDRLDYLLRDGHYTGAGYATYDLDWLLYALRVEEVRGDFADPADLVVDFERGTYAVEQYLFARSYMYAQVYHHKTVRAAECMFLALMRRFAELARAGEAPPGLPAVERLARGEPVSAADYLRLDDVSVSAAMDRWAGCGADGSPPATDLVLRDLSARLRDRRLFKTLHLGNDRRIATAIEAQASEIAAGLFGDHGAYYWHIDSSEQVAYYAGADEEEIRVVGHPRHGTVTLGELLSGLATGQPVASLRLVCAPELIDTLRPLVDEALAGPPRGGRC